MFLGGHRTSFERHPEGRTRPCAITVSPKQPAPCFVMASPRSPHSADPALLCRQTRQIVAFAFQIDTSDMRRQSRGRADVALARQAAMYLANVAGGGSLSDVARNFGRDRSTVAHACKRIEDLRDAPDLDISLALLEGALRSTFRLPDLHGSLSPPTGNSA